MRFELTNLPIESPHTAINGYNEPLTIDFLFTANDCPQINVMDQSGCVLRINLVTVENQLRLLVHDHATNHVIHNLPLLAYEP